jgi:AraC family transcriptional activator FtrA
MPHHVAILAYDRLCTFEVSWYSYAVCAVEAGPLRAAGGLALQVPHGLDAIEAADTIVIPGWRDPAEAPPPPLMEALRRAHARGARLCSICSGAFVLAHAGLLEGRRATTHWRHFDRLAADFPGIAIEADALYVDDGKIVTSAGSAAGLDMLLHLVRSDFGADIANKVAQRLVIPAHRDGDQAQLVARPLPQSNTDPIAQTMDWIRENLRAAHTLASMAAQARLGVRTFQRRFKDRTGASPLDWLVRERVSLAARLLETRPGLGIEAVADLAGLGSSESMRRHFRSHGLPPPASYRRQHKRSSP